ncbi:hypothetical protein C4K26_4335 [Pseudomonas chlororaphis]|uniref:Wzz/FepE/Etk N-terminal domain-containing protein n=1 Tax=Pseudomonas chlororaphis TaxID=587753 RepID=UPI000F57DFCB|nr:Wzz/FepE/Etk N-terminal domain-containing protein [Pseudomonas chlororaphis]AZD09724.1 hypothetical protein C4K26_4335 [Pseudomonas chlororaphis]
MRNDSTNSQNPDEIDAFLIARALWSRIWVIIGITALAGIVGAGYIFLSERVYEAKAYLVPPTQSDITSLNLGRTREFELTPYSIEDVYRIFLRNLQSESLRREFFVNNYLPKLSADLRSRSQDILYAEFSKKILVRQLNTDQLGRYLVVAQAGSAEEAVAWVKDYIKRAENMAKNEILKNVSYEAKVKAKNIDQEINSKRETSEKIRGDSITKLREALRIAQVVGIQRPTLMMGGGGVALTGSMEEGMAFLRGVEALSAEIKNIESRSSNDAFIKELRDLETKKSFYEKFSDTPKEFDMYRYDGVVELPDNAVKPKNVLVMLLALVLGLMLGVLSAFILHGFSDKRIGSCSGA